MSSYLLCRIAALAILLSLRRFTPYENFLLCYVSIGIAHTFWGFVYGWKKYGVTRARELRFLSLLFLAVAGAIAVTFSKPHWGVYLFSLHHIAAEVYYGPERSEQSSALAGLRLAGHFFLYVAITNPFWPLPAKLALLVAGACFLLAWGLERKRLRYWSLADDVLTTTVCAVFVSQDLFASSIDPVFYHIIVWTLFYGLRSSTRYWLEQGLSFSLFWIPTYLLYRLGHMGHLPNSRPWVLVVVVGAFVGFLHVLTTPILTVSQPLWVNRLIHPKRFK